VYRLITDVSQQCCQLQVIERVANLTETAHTHTHTHTCTTSHALTSNPIKARSQFRSGSDGRKVQLPANFSQFRHCTALRNYNKNITLTLLSWNGTPVNYSPWGTLATLLTFSTLFRFRLRKLSRDWQTEERTGKTCWS